MTNEEKKNIFEKAGYINPLDFCYLVPRKYYDFSTLTTDVNKCYEGQFIAVSGILDKLVQDTAYTGKKIIKAHLISKQAGKNVTFHINYFGQKQMYNILKPLLDKECIVAGTFKIFNGYYFINEPVLFSQKSKVKKSYVSVYRKFKGTSEDFLKRKIEESLNNTELVETIPDDIRKDLNIIGRKDSIKQFHSPRTKSDVLNSIKRGIIEDMLYLTCKLIDETKINVPSKYIITGKEQYAHTIKDSLPYELTIEQLKVINNIIVNIKKGKKTSTLVQGDVGCGKSITAFLLMLMFANHGWQSIIMAPTQVLAKQHYIELKSYADKLGIKTTLISGTNTAKQEEKALHEVETGESMLIVGTHKLISEKVKFSDVGLIVIDEEQRFGVEARQRLQEKAGDDAHFISFSATPIPRTVSQTLYSTMDLLKIQQRPSNRKEIITKITSKSEDTLNGIRNEIARGGQAYVVCPFIEDSDDESRKSTVKDVAAYYSKYFNDQVGIITGQLDDKSTERTLKAFSEGKIKILVATTVIEVGINNPNANTIIIEDANLFGLSQLHQLRGRVGRSDKQGYCYLAVKENASAERLQILEQTNDGFEIAEEDFTQRGAGNLIGTEQSGNNHYINLVMKYPNMYKQIKKYADIMTTNGDSKLLISEIEKRNPKTCIKYDKIKYFAS